jgi:hypothetical protein
MQRFLDLLEDNSPMSYVLVLLVAIGVVLCLSLWGCLYPSFYIKGGRGYNEGNRVGYNMISIRTLSLLTYFTDIAICALGNMPWSSRIFLMVGRIIADRSLGLLSLCGVVPRVLILVTRSLHRPIIYLWQTRGLCCLTGTVLSHCSVVGGGPFPGVRSPRV